MCHHAITKKRKLNKDHFLVWAELFYRVIQSLQPHLLFVDCPWQIPSGTAIEHLTSYINTHLKEYVQYGFCSFQFEVVLVIFQGAMQLYTHTAQRGGRSDDVKAAIEGLLLQCPLFTVSCLVSKICIFVLWMLIFMVVVSEYCSQLY